MSTWRSMVSTGSALNKVNTKNDSDDDWETDPDFIVSYSLLFLFFKIANANFFNKDIFAQNDVTEQEQRWGSKTIKGSGRTIGAIE